MPKPETSNCERILKSELVSLLHEDFDMIPEVTGKSLVDGAPLRADFLIYPKPCLVDRGFVKEWIGVEVKEIDFSRHDSKHLYGAFWQTVCYTQTQFSINGDLVLPAACAIYIGKFQKFASVGEIDSPRGAQIRRWQILLELGVYSNTGIITGSSSDDWTLAFGQGSYFTKQRGLSGVPRGLKRYTGNIRKRRKTPESDC